MPTTTASANTTAAAVAPIATVLLERQNEPRDPGSDTSLLTSRKILAEAAPPITGEETEASTLPDSSIFSRRAAQERQDPR
jgi:hypothetical protein